MREYVSREGPAPAEGSSHSHVWLLGHMTGYSLWAFDKVYAFETGRPSSIKDSDCTVSLDVAAPECTFAINGSSPLNLLGCLVSLCSQLSQITNRLFSPGVIDLSIEEALKRIGEEDAALQRWSNSVPLEIRPGNDAPSNNTLLPYSMTLFVLYNSGYVGELYIVVCSELMLPYYARMITLHRLSLFHSSLISSNLHKPSLGPYTGRLQASASVCLNSARLILAGFERTLACPSQHFWTLQSVFAAIIVVAIHTWQHPALWQARADLIVIQHASELAAEIYRAIRFPDAFIQILPRLYEKTKNKVERPGQPSRPGSPRQIREEHQQRPSEPIVSDQQPPPPDPSRSAVPPPTAPYEGEDLAWLQGLPSSTDIATDGLQELQEQDLQALWNLLGGTGSLVGDGDLLDNPAEGSGHGGFDLEFLY